MTNAQRYQGYLATPLLWEDDAVASFRQIAPGQSPAKIEASVAFTQRRLGKLVEEFVYHQLKNTPGIEWVTDGLQIQQAKRSVGEIDALYRNDGVPIHLEVAYKFYLYDTLEQPDNPLARWIGPNRKDNLALKLGKLREKQFPLLRHSATLPYLQALYLAGENIEQGLCFKGQLFLPYREQSIEVSPLNSACVTGFYLGFNELETLKECSFYLPEKLDWLVIPHHAVDWLDFKAACALIERSISENRSPLVWLQRPGGMLEKCFVVFWG